MTSGMEIGSVIVESWSGPNTGDRYHRTANGTVVEQKCGYGLPSGVMTVEEYNRRQVQVSR